MAERPELLGLGNRDRIRARQEQRHCSRSATGADPAGLQRACYRRTSDCCTAEGRTSSAGEEVGVGRSHCLSGLRQAFLHAEAASDDGP